MNAGGGKPLAMPAPQDPNLPDKHNDGVSTIWDMPSGLEKARNIQDALSREFLNQT